MKSLIFNALLLSLISINVMAQDAPMQETGEFKIESLKVLTVDSSINPATFNYLGTELDKSAKKENEAVLIKIDTPGGLVSTTKEIITKIGEMDYPVIVWITPEGASATSAGAIIASAAHVLVMSKGTNIGAATPISMNGDIGGKKKKKKTTQDNSIEGKITEEVKKKMSEDNMDEGNGAGGSDMRAKAINDLVALVSALSKTRGRNPKAFATMITDAASYDHKDALDKKIIDGIVSNQSQLLKFIQNRTVSIKGEAKKLSIAQGVEINNVDLDPGQALLNIFANPTTAYILFVIGAALLYFEFQAPGGFIAGALGAICLVLSGIGFQVLPLNFGALGLILLSFVLFIIEIYVTSYGILTLGGIASLVFGSLFLFRTDNAYIEIQLPVILSVVVAIVLYVVVIAWVFLKMKRKQGETFLTQENQVGYISKYDKEEEGEHYYRVKINGEIWRAKSKTKYELKDKVNVLEQDNDKLILILE